MQLQRQLQDLTTPARNILGRFAVHPVVRVAQPEFMSLLFTANWGGFRDHCEVELLLDFRRLAQISTNLKVLPSPYVRLLTIRAAQNIE